MDAPRRSVIDLLAQIRHQLGALSSEEHAQILTLYDRQVDVGGIIEAISAVRAKARSGNPGAGARPP